MKSANKALMSSSRMPQKGRRNCIYPTGLKVAQERPIFKVSSPGSYALSWIDSQSDHNFYLLSGDEDCSLEGMK